jgi:glycoside/pentoside/hexuronide:cation symporter, GPH family
MKQWHKIFYAVGSLGTALSYQAFVTHIQFLYIDLFGLSAALIGVGWTMYGIWNAINDPLAGAWSDRTRTRWGRRRPWITVFAGPVGLLFLLLWIPPQALIDQGGSPLFLYFMIVVLIFDLVWTIVVMNWTALFPEMFTGEQERASVSGWREVFSVIGLIAGVALMPILAGEGWADRGPVALGFAVVIAGSFFVSLIGAREPKDLPDDPIVPFVTSLKATLGNLAFRWFIVANLSKEFVFSMLSASMPFYAKYVLGASTNETGYLLGAAFVAAVPGLAIWTALAKRFGAWRAWRWACVTFGLSLVPLLLISSVNAAYVFMVLIGLSLAGHLMLSNLLISDAIDADEVDTRTRRAGMYFGINGFLIRFAFSLQGLALGLVLSVSGYVQPAAPTDVPAQPAAALWGMRILIAVLPMLAMAIAYWAISRYPLHGEKLTVLKQRLTELRASAGA